MERKPKKMNLKEYLKHAVHIEMLIHEQQMSIKSLKSTIHTLKNYKYESKVDTTSFLQEGIVGVGRTIGWFSAAVCFVSIVAPIVCALGALVGNDFLYSLFMKLGIFEWWEIGVLICLPVGVLILIIKEYQRIQRNSRVRKKNVIIEKNNQKIYARNAAKIQKLTIELDAAVKNLSDTCNIRNRFYNQNIIHPKYRNLVAVCSLYEYFETGRCNTLTGHEGAYNIYEKEIRLNRIIMQLDEVIENLNKIRSTQYELFQAINTCNRNISNLDGHLKAFTVSTNRIAENSAITAYNSRIAAENTTEMKWMISSK